MRTLLRSFLMCLTLVLCSTHLYAEPTIPAFTTTSVIDTSNTLTQQQIVSLQKTVDAIEQRVQGGAQMAVLVIPSLEGGDIESFAIRVFEQWKLGKLGKDNGVLLVIAMEERSVRIEVGYGFEGDIPDVVAGRIIRSTLIPAFQQNNFYGGIQNTLTQIGNYLQSGEAPENQESLDRQDFFVQTIFFSFFISAFISRFTANAKKHRIPLNSGLAFIGAQATTLASFSSFLGNNLFLLIFSLPLSLLICTLFSSFLFSAQGRNLIRSSAGGYYSRRNGGFGGGFGRGGGSGRNGGGGGRSGGGGASGRW